MMPGQPTLITLVGAAFHTPAGHPSLAEVCAAEGIDCQGAAELGIVGVPAGEGETPSELALAAAQAALAQAGVSPGAVHAILDYSILPQEYLTPAWNMSNKLQHELGATNAFTLGFSGGGASNFLVALSAGVALLQTEEALETVLLVGADMALPGNRALVAVGPAAADEAPVTGFEPAGLVTILGDGAGAVVLRRVSGRAEVVAREQGEGMAGREAQGGSLASDSLPGRRVVDTELVSVGDHHDICLIRGGALAHPDRPDLYRLQLDGGRYAATPRYADLVGTAGRLLARAGLSWEAVAGVIYTNLSTPDQVAFVAALQAAGWPAPHSRENGSRFFSHGQQAQLGHIQGSDLVINYLAAEASGRLHRGDYVLLCSHGLGFLYGAALVQW